ncbi:hypothetical protein [Natribacillus halophilus]|uniref:Uncharacterized protein n=1 Tax=Natribacillus halophilus TaxID=549003 RepID=A0A1G8SDB2_9BACI|nr:hypothetical protein [Natribacillus halophilus]SDJ27246.1 hypothetical protein SAMN04488123_1263 [Natribacillus halophilus]
MDSDHTEELTLQQERNEQLIHDIMDIDRQIAKAKQENAEIVQEKEDYEQKCATIERSFLWKCSKPVRKLRAWRKQ